MIKTRVNLWFNFKNTPSLIRKHVSGLRTSNKLHKTAFCSKYFCFHCFIWEFCQLSLYTQFYDDNRKMCRSAPIRNVNWSFCSVYGVTLFELNRLFNPAPGAFCPFQLFVHTRCDMANMYPVLDFWPVFEQNSLEFSKFPAKLDINGDQCRSFVAETAAVKQCTTV